MPISIIAYAADIFMYSQRKQVDSDIDIALLIKNDCLRAEKYTAGLAEIASEMAMKYFAIVNFVCLPYDEFVGKKEWYE